MTYINSYITVNLQGVGGLFHLGLSKIIILRAFTLVVLENLTFEHSHVYNRKKKMCKISTVLPKNDPHQFVYNCKFTSLLQ